MMKIIKQLFSFLLLLSIGFLVSCGGDGIGGTGPSNPGIDSTKETITRVTVPFREHGYSSFETQVIDSQDKFDRFIVNVNRQSNWNNKDTFIKQINVSQLNYAKENLLLFRITEPSGSTSLKPRKPVIKNNTATIIIDRKVPSVGTADMAYYVIAYRVGKSITKVLFDNGTSKIYVNLSKSQGKLRRSDKTALLSYFQGAIKRHKDTRDNTNYGVDSPTVRNESSGVSSTNLQEAGVDEADLIKTDGRYIFSVKKSDVVQVVKGVAQGIVPEKNKVYSDNIRIMDTQNASGITEVKRFSDKKKPWNITGLYLHDSHSATASNKRLIALSSEKQNYSDHWFDSNYFRNQKTDVLFFDVNDPQKASIKTKLSFEGQLIDSRRNGDILYLILRHHSNYKYIDDKKLAITTNETFLPTYKIGDASKQLIAKQEDCFLEKGQKGTADVITLVAVDLKAPTLQVKSQCYVGSAEAIYASQKALYLATTRWDYKTDNGFAEYDRRISTDIHKFAYSGLDFDYRGSGEVAGHLGDRQNSKSFRFSEHKGLLRVVTFNQAMWGPITALPVVDVVTNNETRTGSTVKKKAKNSEVKSPVFLSILEEDSGKKALKVISKLPNANRPEPIGLPDEQLYATRFMGDRAFIVTFRVTDPLYILDLSDSSDPKIAGELKIDGYSEYLHPISDTLLLGVGKDAIPGKKGDGRGGWYQGVKLSLIDVTDPSSPQEVDKIILGKRGTKSTALFTHHALTGLKVNDKYRIAIPVQLHAKNPASQGKLSASTRYGYSHTGLHRFEVDINNQTINKVPALIIDSASYKVKRNIFSDRSVLINDEVFYMHKGDFWTQDWQGGNAITGPK